MILATTFKEVMTNAGFIVLALFALMFMVVVHELGHYTAGKILGFKIMEFGIGFGPCTHRVQTADRQGPGLACRS